MIAAGCKSAAVSPKLFGGPRARNLRGGGAWADEVVLQPTFITVL